MDVLKVVSVGLKPHFEELKAHLEELMVVAAFENGVVNIAHQVLEERANHHVQNLAYLQIYILGKGGRSVVLLELHATGDVLLSCLQVYLV